MRAKGVKIAAAALVLCVVSACGAGERDTGSSAKLSSDAASQLMNKVDADLAAARQAQTSAPPTSGPKAVPGKKVFVISCSMAAEGCARQANAAMEAIQKIGWQGTLIDTAFDPTKIAAAVQQAVSARVDGIVMTTIDASLVPGPLKQAQDAGIKIIGLTSTNKDNLYNQVIPSENDFVKAGYTIAEAAYKLANGDLRMVKITADEFAVVKLREQGTDQFLKECGGNCTVVEEKNSLGADLTTNLAGQTIDIMRRNPKANVLWAPYDAAATFMVQGLQQAGLTSSGGLVGFDANSQNLDAIRQAGYQKYDIGLPFRWVGYAAVDNLNRLFAGQQVLDPGISSKLFDKSNVPAGGAWDGDIDVRPAYLRLWGVS